LTRFNVELQGETLWATAGGGAAPSRPAGRSAALTEELAQRLARARPELVAVTGEQRVAAELADELRRRDLARSVFLITPAEEQEVSGPGRVQVVLPEQPAKLEPESLLLHLLRAILALQARTPLSPLTGMAGSAVLREEVERRLAARQGFIFLYLDLDNFKAFNDVYGFGRGDMVIRALGAEIASAVKSHGQPGDLCVHIGGDDFAVVTQTQDATALADTIRRQFREKAREFYDAKARESGYIETRSRRGEPTRYPLMTVSVGGVNPGRRHFESYLQLTEVAAEMKGYAKALGGDRFVMDRRQDSA
jgi:diguanylate cyclase (GGDEF)-like protein